MEEAYGFFLFCLSFYFVYLLMQQNKMLLLTNSFRGRKPQGNLLGQFDESDCQVVGCIGDHCATLEMLNLDIVICDSSIQN